MTQLTLFKKSLVAAIGVACLTFITENAKPAAAASFTAVNPVAPTRDFNNGVQWSLGFKFTTNRTINVTALGFYDDLKNGFTQTHDIGIFDNSGARLVTGTVSPTNNDNDLEENFRYTSVLSTQSTLLQAGGTFFIAATTGLEKYTFNNPGEKPSFVVNPNITFRASAFVASRELAFPSFTDASIGYFGPNFKAEEVAAVPTPALLPGLIGLAIGAWRKRKADAAKTDDV